MKITRIENQKKRPGRKNIYADDAFLIGVGAETLLRFGLRTGDEITPEKLALLARTEELLGAKNAALRYMSTRPRSEREVHDKLREKEYGEEEIGRIIEDLKRAGLLNDGEFARAFIRNALVLRPTGGAVLKRKLLLLGVGKEVVEEALGDVLAGADLAGEAARAAAAFVRKARASGRKADPVKLRQRLTAFLIRRGFTWDVVRTAVKNTLKGGDDDETG
jgi:regulatory protein